MRRDPDTGVRDITGLITAAVTSGRLLVQRKRSRLIVVGDDLVFAEAGTNVPLPRLADGYRPRWRLRETWYPSTGYTAGGTFSVTPAGYSNIYSVVAGQPISFYAEVEAAGAFPSNLMGVSG
jgi:hypothetical protein